MPTRTTTKTKTTIIKTTKELKSMMLTNEMSPPTTTTSIIKNPTLRTTATLNNNPTDENSTKSTNPPIRFRRSYSVPILKIDDAARARIYGIKAAELSCDKNFTSPNHNRLNGANQTRIQQEQQEKTFMNEYASVETTSSEPIPIPAIRTAKTTTIKCTTKATTPSATTTMPTTIKGRTTRLRSASMIASNGDHVEHDDHGDDDDIKSVNHAHHHIREELRFGCGHYKRRAMFVTPCCGKFYKCRFCHDENESHHFDRKTLNELICSECNKRQKVQEACVNCGVRFGRYTCLICNLFDDEDKKQYHCDACGICRIGGAENFFHCEVCNMCLPIQLKIDGHKCVENISRSHCPVCLGDIHTSRIPCHIPDCGHLLHKMCFDQLLASGHYVCPTCQTSLIDMTALWDFLDAQASQMPLPKKYENQKIHIFCNDCQRTSKTKFHFIGLKCMECGAYNTTQDVKRRVSLVPDETNTA